MLQFYMMLDLGSKCKIAIEVCICPFFPANENLDYGLQYLQSFKAPAFLPQLPLLASNIRFLILSGSTDVSIATLLEISKTCSAICTFLPKKSDSTKTFFCETFGKQLGFTLGCKLFAQGKKQLKTMVIIKISTQPCQPRNFDLLT